MATATDKPTATALGEKFASHITNKTILITGPSPNSIAAQLAIALAPQKPKLIILAGRSASKLDETARQVTNAAPGCPTRNLIVDFGSLSSVRKAAKEVNEYAEDIDVAVLSAGIMAPPYRKTDDGFESSFATNHLGHFLFVNSIVGKVQAAAKKSADGARIVAVSSDGHAVAGIGKDFDEINFNDGKTYNQWRSYGQSKTANCLYALSLSDKLAKDNIQAFPLHPGVIFTTSLSTEKTNEDWEDFGQVREKFASGLSHERRAASTNNHTKYESAELTALMKTADEGAATMMVAGFDPSIKEQSGAYLQDCKIDLNACEDHAKGRAEAERLWKISEECVGQKFDF